MELKELQHEVEELEPRIERLRSLYEQYFMGLEKTEPATLRRDVDRKLWQLRKVRIQNTALRFRLQMLIQRYNTYQQYWARVMREMERGTYRRDVLRAAKRIGSREALTIVGRRRAKMFKELAEAQEARRDRAVDLAAQTAAELEAALSEGPGGGAGRPAPAASGSPASLVDPSQWSFSDPPTGEWARRDDAALDPPTTEWVARPGELDAEDDVPTLPPPAPGGAEQPATGLPTGVLMTPRVPSTPAPASPPSPLPPPSSRRPLPPPSSRRPLPPPSSRRPLPPPSSIRPLPPPSQRSPLPPPSDAGPPLSSPPGKPRRPPPAPPAARSPRVRQPAANREADRDRMRSLYDEYVQAKRRAKESTDGLSLEKLERSLRRQTERLRKKHGNKQIDYEVVTQNGRPLIRPKIK